MVEFDYATLELPSAGVGVPELRSQLILSDLRGVEPVKSELKYEGGLKAFVSISTGRVLRFSPSRFSLKPNGRA